MVKYISRVLRISYGFLRSFKVVSRKYNNKCDILTGSLVELSGLDVYKIER